MTKIENIQKILFFTWTVCLAVFMQFVVAVSDPTPAYAFVAVLLGIATFGLLWLIAAYRFVVKKPRINAVKLPLYSVIVSLFFFLGLQQVTASQYQPVVEQTHTMPSPTLTPKPSSAPKSAQNYIKPTQQPLQKTEPRKCYDPEGNVVADEKCAALWANEPVEQNQPNAYDYYVPPTYTYDYEPTNYYVPEPPKYETYTPSYPSTTIETEPFPSLGPSYNPNPNCETYTTNGGSTTICK